MAELEFRATIAGSYRRILVFIAFWVITIVAAWACWVYMYNDQLLRHPEEKPMWNFIVGIVIIAFIWGLVTEQIPKMIELWTCAFFVKVTPEEVIGQNLWKEEFRIRLSEIESIKAEPKRALVRVLPNIVLATHSGETMVIHTNVVPLGDCIEHIVRSSPNLVETDFGGLDNVDDIWRGAEKL